MLLIRAQWSKVGTPTRRTKKLFNYTYILFLRLHHSEAGLWNGFSAEKTIDGLSGNG